ncbi:DUF2779 domain-containing protein [Colwellia piezophila]|uniref:DUF2779 domain-containing protein n=1 Tax=Colwellia piezophila TaxID=211668 RepID=UPI00036B6731|nr:DUF2779 domain-containing protein [Colwellia piezophila]
MSKPRYLTKSRFKMATECPTKLFYSGKNSYADSKLEDSFLQALAEGGFQVGELAKCYYPQGQAITAIDYEEAQQQTLALLSQENVVLFEPAIRFNNLFVRIDILVKQGNHFELIEVKAKSYSKQEDNEFLGARGGIISGWKPYLYDVAFQKHVLEKAFPNSTVTSFLMLVDKNSVAVTDGLNQKFLMTKDANNRKGVKVSSNLTAEDLSAQFLTKVNVDKILNKVYAEELATGMPTNTFKGNIELLAQYYEKDEKIAPVIGKKCKTCEFTCTAQEEAEGKLSGYKTCWKEQLHWQDEDFNDQSVLQIWSFKRAEELINEGIVKIKDVEKEHLNIKTSDSFAMTQSERQWLQIEKVKNNDTSIEFDSGTMEAEMAKWTYPLHFIDFETNASAIPFFKGMAPYEGIAFQFSHHVLHEDGRVEHAGEFLNTEVGQFPNFEFVRELKRQLENDEGTIFRYSSHENTYLNLIYRQLAVSTEVDKLELSDFIKTITKSGDKSKEIWSGDRLMVDLWVLVKKYYYDPATNGSNSIKAVLPAVLNSSAFLKEKYGQAIYGSEQMPSCNFTKQQWLQIDNDGQVKDPYKLLPKMFADISEHEADLLSETDELNNGGLALTAYSKMQFTQMSEYERTELDNALLKYCELDTLAMVMIVEAWQSWCRS